MSALNEDCKQFLSEFWGKTLRISVSRFLTGHEKERRETIEIFLTDVRLFFTNVLLTGIVCMFIWSLWSHSRIFHSYGNVTIAGEELQILTYARHSWPLSSEGLISLTCHTHWDAGLPFIMVISEDPCHSHLMPSVWQWSCHYVFLRLRSVATGDRTSISRMRDERSTSTPPRRLEQ